MKMSNKRIIEYDAVSETRTDDNLLMDSPAVGTRKITATNLIKPAMDAVSNEETERERAVSAESTARQNGDTNLDGKKFGNFVSTTDVTIGGVTYKTFWVIAPTSSNQVYGIANHPTNGKLYKIYNNYGTFTAEPYDLNATKGDEISIKDGQTGTIQTGVVSTIAADTSLDNAIGTLLNNDVTQDKQISDIESNLTDLDTTVTTLDSDSGWITTSSNTGKRRKVGKMVTIYFEFTVSATRTWHNIDTIPEGWRSSKDMYIAAVGGDHRQYIAGAKLDTATNTFRIYANTSATYFGSITYPVG